MNQKQYEEAKRMIAIGVEVFQQLQAVFEQLIGWGNNFGFDFPTVYEAYKKKNEENNARAKSNY